MPTDPPPPPASQADVGRSLLSEQISDSLVDDSGDGAQCAICQAPVPADWLINLCERCSAASSSSPPPTFEDLPTLTEDFPISSPMMLEDTPAAALVGADAGFLQLLRGDADLEEDDPLVPMPPQAGQQFLQAPVDAVGIHRGKIREKRQKNKEVGLKLLRSIGPLVGVNGTWLDEARRLLLEAMSWEGTVWNWGEIKSRHVIGACLMYIARSHGVPLSFARLAELLGVPESSLGKTYVHLQSRLPERLRPTKAFDYIPSILSNRFVFSTEDMQKVMSFGRRLCDYLEKHSETGIQGKDPLVLAAVLIMFALECVLPKSHQLEIRSMTGVHENSREPLYISRSPPGLPHVTNYYLNPKVMDSLATQVSMLRRELLRHYRTWFDYLRGKILSVLPWADRVNRESFPRHLEGLFELAEVDDIFDNLARLESELLPSSTVVPQLKTVSQTTASRKRKSRQGTSAELEARKHRISLFERSEEPRLPSEFAREAELPTEQFMARYELDQLEQ